MKKKKVFFSFHFDKDVFRVQLIRNMGMIEGNHPVNAQQWETIKKSPDSVKRWIDSEMKKCDCVCVLIGEETASREWVKYEIMHACSIGKPLFGIYIHNLKDIKGNKSLKGKNPFSLFTYKGESLANIIPVYNPDRNIAYEDINLNISNLADGAISI